MSISARCLAIFLCAALPAHAQTTAKKTPTKAAPAKSTTARAPQGDVSPLPAPDVEFTAPVIVPARATATAQTASATTAVEGDLAQFLSGKLVPLDIKLSDMKAGWQSLRVVRAEEKNSADEPRNHSPGPGYDPWQQLIDRFGSDNNRYFTQGQTLRFNNDTHLVVYRTQFPAEQETAKFFEPRLSVYHKNNTTLEAAVFLPLLREFLDTIPVRASLLNTRNISAMEDVSAFNFDTQFADYSKILKAEFAAEEAKRQKQIAATKSDPAIENNLKQLFEGIQQYTQDYDEKLPPLKDLATARKAIEPYVRDKNAWMDDLKIKLHPNALLSGKPLAHLKPYASSMILFYSDADAHGERWVLRLDGQVRRVNAAQWPQLKIAARIP